MKLTIHNYRDGFASNSSSTHSIVMYKNEDKLNSLMEVEQDDYFGWGFFVLKDSNKKLAYFYSLLFHSFCTIMHPDYAKHVLTSMFPVNGESGFKDIYNEDVKRIDHQSCINFPGKTTIKGSVNIFNESFINEFKEFILKDNVVVHGGNDNEHRENTVHSFYDFLGTFSNIKAKKDGNVWILMDRSSGRKVRFTFDNPEKDPEYYKSNVPELIDIKVTDLCKNECECKKYCYQGSSNCGSDNLAINIHNLALSLANAGVMEVALGGGEIFDLPYSKITHIISSFRCYDIIVNLTSRKYDVFKDLKLISYIYSNVGQIAFSVSSIDDICKLRNYIDEWRTTPEYKALNWSYKPFVIQIVANTIPKEQFKETISYAQEKFFYDSVTILGYKSNEFNRDFTPYDYNPILVMHEVCEDKEWIYYNIDTAIARQYEYDINKLNVPVELYYAEEGKFSMYIDAVEGTISKSSYDPEVIKIPSGLFGTYNSNEICEFMMDKFKEW